MKSGSKDVLNFTFQCLWGLTLATALLHVEATAAIPRSRIESIMRSANWTTGTVLSYPGQEAFSRSTERWTVYEPPSYSASVTVETEADVVKAVSSRLKSFIVLLLSKTCPTNHNIRLNWQDHTVSHFWPRAVAMVTIPTWETSRTAWPSTLATSTR